MVHYWLWDKGITAATSEISSSNMEIIGGIIIIIVLYFILKK